MRRLGLVLAHVKQYRIMTLTWAFQCSAVLPDRSLTASDGRCVRRDVRSAAPPLVTTGPMPTTDRRPRWKPGEPLSPARRLPPLLVRPSRIRSRQGPTQRVPAETRLPVPSSLLRSRHQEAPRDLLLVPPLWSQPARGRDRARPCR